MTVSMPNYTSLRSTMRGAEYMDFGALQYNLSLTFSETSFLTKESYGSPAVDGTGNSSDNDNDATDPAMNDWLDAMRDMIGDFGPFTSANIG